MPNRIIAPSLLSADFSDLRSAIKTIDKAGAPWVHFDIMDGVFVPNITFGAKVVSDLRPFSSAIFDVHLMVERPELFIDDFAAAGADFITFHAEACIHTHRLIKRIQELKIKAGIAIIPSTPICTIQEILPEIDLVLVMTVNPGFGGQTLISSCLDKVLRIKDLRNETKLGYLISVDGGLNKHTAKAAWGAGIDIMVVGSAFFGSLDKTKLMKELIM